MNDKGPRHTRAILCFATPDHPKKELSQTTRMPIHTWKSITKDAAVLLCVIS